MIIFYPIFSKNEYQDGCDIHLFTNLFRCPLRHATWSLNDNANRLPNWSLSQYRLRNVLTSLPRLAQDPEPTQERFRSLWSRNGVTFQLLNLASPNILKPTQILILIRTTISLNSLILYRNSFVFTVSQSIIFTYNQSQQNLL